MCLFSHAGVPARPMAHFEFICTILQHFLAEPMSVIMIFHRSSASLALRIARNSQFFCKLPSREFLADVRVALREENVVDSAGLCTNEMRVEPHSCNGNDVFV